MLHDVILDSEYDEDIGSNFAIAKLEQFTLDYLSQLARSLSHRKVAPECGREADTESSDSEDNSESSSARPCVKIELADRTKIDSATGEYGVKILTYPKKSATSSAKTFAQLFAVASAIHGALIEGIPVTKRDIYYRDVTLFKKQRTVDNLVDDLAATLKLERSDLNVRATSKGTFCGSVLTIHLSSGDVIWGHDSEASLIPAGEDVETLNIDDDLAWVLVVEKDAVFQTLCHLNAANHPSLPGKGIIITGKGYPDMATRHLVKNLSDFLPRTIPIVVLVDGDPYGLDILSVYKYGSSRLRHENEKLAAGRIKWLGLISSELAGLGIDKDALIPISRHDEKKALAMLQRPRDVMPAKWRKELMYMLHNRRKAEIEILSLCKPSVESQPPFEEYQDSSRSPTPSKDVPTPHLSPLLAYLLLKLPHFVSTARQAAGPSRVDYIYKSTET